MSLYLVKDLVMRVFALFLATALPAIGVGAFAGVSVLNSALIAGGLAVSRVVTDLAKAFLDDGKLTQEEIDSIFKKANKKEETK